MTESHHSGASYSASRAVLVFLALALASAGVGAYVIYSVAWEGRAAHLYWLGMTVGVLAIAMALPALGFALALIKRHRKAA